MKSPRLSLGVGLILGLVLVLLANYLSFRHYKRWDWTSEGWFTLSERTREVLASLDQDIDIYLFFARGEMHFADLDSLLEEYRAASPRIRIERIDPDRDAARYQVLAAQFGIPTIATEVGVLSQIPVVVTSGERKWKIEREDLLIEDFASFDDASGPKLNVQSERAMTGAILEVISETETKACVTQELGEWPLGAAGDDDRNLTRLAAELDWEKIKVERVEVLGGKVIPKDCNALFVIGPQRAFSDVELASIGTYLDTGGNVLLALDPIITKDKIAETGFEPWLRDRGIRLGRDVVLEFDPSRVLPPGSIDAFVVTGFRPHRVTGAILERGGGAAFALARSVEPVEGSPAQVLATTSPRSYAEPNLKALLKAAADGDPLDDRPFDAVSVVVAVEPPAPEPAEDGSTPAPKKEGGRLIVIGDSDWLQPAFLDEVRFSNVDLLSSITGWMIERDALITLAPRKANARSVLMTEGDLTNVFFRVVVLLPLGFLVLGFGLWWTRRS